MLSKWQKEYTNSSLLIKGICLLDIGVNKAALGFGNW